MTTFVHKNFSIGVKYLTYLQIRYITLLSN